MEDHINKAIQMMEGEELRDDINSLAYRDLYSAYDGVYDALDKKKSELFT